MAEGFVAGVAVVLEYEPVPQGHLAGQVVVLEFDVPGQVSVAGTASVFEFNVLGRAFFSGMVAVFEFSTGSPATAYGIWPQERLKYPGVQGMLLFPRWGQM